MGFAKWADFRTGELLLALSLLGAVLVVFFLIAILFLVDALTLSMFLSCPNHGMICVELLYNFVLEKNYGSWNNHSKQKLLFWNRVREEGKGSLVLLSQILHWASFQNTSRKNPMGRWLFLTHWGPSRYTNCGTWPQGFRVETVFFCLSTQWEWKFSGEALIKTLFSNLLFHRKWYQHLYTENTWRSWFNLCVFFRAFLWLRQKGVSC